jgi:hypothetical protein
MNSNAFFNRMEILLYSTLISVMSGINHLRAHFQHSSTIPIQPSSDEEAEPYQLNGELKVRSLTMNWSSIQEALLSILLWVVLGFAAGFLIGMINPR